MKRLSVLLLFLMLSAQAAGPHDTASDSGTAEPERPTAGERLTYDDATRVQIRELAQLVAQMLEVTPGLGGPTGEQEEDSSTNLVSQ